MKHFKANPVTVLGRFALNQVLNLDPTRTTVIRNQFVANLTRRFKQVRQTILISIIENDCFGLAKERPVGLAAINRKQFAFKTSTEKVSGFMSWLEEEVDKNILEVHYAEAGRKIVGHKNWEKVYIDSAYKKGMARANSEMVKKGIIKESQYPASPMFPVDAMFNRPLHADRCFIEPKVKVLTSKGQKKIKDIKVGDLVLTHKGRFKKVKRLIFTPKQKPDVVRVSLGFAGKSKREKAKMSLTATEGHPFLTNEGWVDVENLKVGSKVRYLAGRCERCGCLIPYWLRFCSLNCIGKLGAEKAGWTGDLEKRKKINVKSSVTKQRHFKEGTLDRFAMTKAANEKTRQLSKEGRNGFQRLTSQQKDELQRKAYDGKLSAIENGEFGFQNEAIREKALANGKVVITDKIVNGKWGFQRPETRKRAIENARNAVKAFISNGGQWGFQRADVMEKIIASSRTPEAREKRSEYMTSNYPMKRPEIASKQGASLRAFYYQHPEKHPRHIVSQKGFMTSIERKVKDFLDRAGIEYKQEYPIRVNPNDERRRVYWVDFALPELGMVIECDGEYFHKDKEKDQVRQRRIEEEGWEFARFTGSDINHHFENVKDEISRIAFNHSGDYEFLNLEVTELKKWSVQHPKTLYNLSVEEDESYVVNGFVVHNCGLLYTRTFNELKGITEAMDQQISRVLSEGMAQGLGPAKIARNITDRVDKIGITRARTMARTEVIRAHHVATINTYREAQVEGVRVKAEWSTAGDMRVCIVGGNAKVLTKIGLKKIKDVEVGDEVWTHKDRYRKVLKVWKRWTDEDVVSISLKGMMNRNGRHLTVTSNHQLLVERAGKEVWVSAGKLEGTDRVCYFARLCPTCGKKMPMGSRYCSLSCCSKVGNKQRWSNPIHHDNASERSKQYWSNPTHHFSDVNQAIHNGCFVSVPIKSIEPYKLKNRLGKGQPVYNLSVEEDDSYTVNYMVVHNCDICAGFEGRVYTLDQIEGMIPAHANCLIDSQIPIYTLQGWKPIGSIAVGDMVLTHKGRFRKVTYLHRIKKQKPDAVKIHVGSGYNAVRLSLTSNHPVLVDGKWIRADKVEKGMEFTYLADKCKRCGKAIPWFKKYCSQTCISKDVTDRQWADPKHRENMSRKASFGFLGMKVTKVEKWKVKSPHTLFNLSVEEDESYIAHGFVIHNCRCCAIPAGVGEARVPKETIPEVDILPLPKVALPERVRLPPTRIPKPIPKPVVKIPTLKPEFPEPARIPIKKSEDVFYGMSNTKDFRRGDKGVWTLNGKDVSGKTMARLNKMGIPPAWKNVYVAATEEAPLQVVGLDKVGRIQRRYSAAHVERQAQEKFNRVKQFSADKKNIRTEIVRGMKKEQPESMLLDLEDRTAIRVGTSADLKAEKKAYGLTTLEKQHISIRGNRITLDFTAKEGKHAHYEVDDGVLISWLKKRLGKTKINEKLFSDVSASKLNSYLKKISGKDYSVKDFRTYHASRIAFGELKKYANAKLTIKERKQLVKNVCAKVSNFLKNTPTMAKNSYIDPMAWEIIGGLP